jgi:hypothetical protein
VPCRAVGDAAQNNNRGYAKWFLYDAAQRRGEVARIGDNLPSVTKQNSKPTAADIGLPRKQIHEARAVRDAEKNDCRGGEPILIPAILNIRQPLRVPRFTVRAGCHKIRECP